MEKDTILNKVVTLEEVTATTTQTGKVRFKIKAGGLNFGLWKIKADGQPTKAFQFLDSLGNNAVGEMVEVAYKEDEGEYNGKSITYRTIINMKRPSEADALMATPVQREEQTYQKNGSLEQKVSDLEKRISALENPKATVSQMAVPGDENYIDPDKIPF